MTVKELSEKTGKSQAAIYNLARKLGPLLPSLFFNREDFYFSPPVGEV